MALHFVTTAQARGEIQLRGCIRPTSRILSLTIRFCWNRGFWSFRCRGNTISRDRRRTFTIRTCRPKTRVLNDKYMNNKWTLRDRQLLI